MLRGVIGGWLACSIGVGLLASSALAAVPHTVQPGESMWSISAANGLTTQTLALYNGVSQEALLLPGRTLYVPTGQEVGLPIPAAEPASSAGATTSTTTVAPAAGLGHVPSPYGQLPLAPAAADAWNAMRAEALSVYGTDIYPGGPLSAYRTYGQQAELYRAFLAGYGAPANPPGSSSHELGTGVDVESPAMRSVIDQIGWKYGWSKVSAPSEWWHVDYVGG
jgi:LysM domain/D-alanyl-D-alanine carboxypeptidase